MNSTATTFPSPNITSRADWLLARRALLEKEKNLVRQHDALAAERRKLPWVRLEKDYVFEGPDGRETLAELFRGRSQLIVYHFMFGRDWEEGCPSCSFGMDHVDGMLPHLNARDVTFLAVSRAPFPQLEAFRQRMGWRFKWVSDADSGFNADFLTSFTKEEIETGRVTYNFQPIPAGALPVEELPGLSVFARDEAGTIFHTYSTYARGCEVLLGTYRLLDLTPKGRDEDALASSMAWLRYHDRYDRDYRVDPAASYQPPRGSIFRPCCDSSHGA